MEDTTRTFSDVRNVILSAHQDAGPKEKVAFYSDWADNYEQDVEILEYRAPVLATECLSAVFRGDRGAALVLDVACGTGLVCAQLQKVGFSTFIGVDGSQAMLDMAKNKGVYWQLKQCILGTEPLPVQPDSCDVIIIVGALSVGQVPTTIVKELWQAAKPGGYLCMTTRGNAGNLEYKDQLEHVLHDMECQGLLVREDVVHVEQWERAVSEGESGYIPGVVYLYRKSLDYTMHAAISPDCAEGR